MDIEEYKIQFIQAKVNLIEKQRENIKERLSLNKLLTGMQGHREIFQDLDLEKEYVKIKYTFQAYLNGLEYEGNCLEEMEDLFKEE
jgi:hypothetical protein